METGGKQHRVTGEYAPEAGLVNGGQVPRKGISKEMKVKSSLCIWQG